MKRLCYLGYNKLGDICTTDCPERSRCQQKRFSLLIETASTKCSPPEQSNISGIFTVSFSISEVTQNAFLNGVLDD
ncbi:hypothetical protein [Methanosarcina horonobensis]|uniref:hypothetical protein n=1 Tax=Methanosarcina horonobensis TaxID=418008 RepID=UPI000A97EA77|nr:hypothetical protein [Methanosarcina horonobensis]